MITQNNIDNLYKITSNLSYKDYLKMNPIDASGKPKYRNHRQYSLSDETLEAKNIYTLSIKAEISREEEEEIKGYLLKIKMLFPDLLEENESFKQWKNANN